MTWRVAMAVFSRRKRKAERKAGGGASDQPAPPFDPRGAR